MWCEVDSGVFMMTYLCRHLVTLCGEMPRPISRASVQTGCRRVVRRGHCALNLIPTTADASTEIAQSPVGEKSKVELALSTIRAQSVLRYRRMGVSCCADERPSDSALDARAAPAWGIARQDAPGDRQHNPETQALLALLN